MSFSVRLFVGCVAYSVLCANTYAIEGAGTASVDLEAQCRLEAASYGIPSEQMEEYLEGCMLASGGSLTAAPEQSASIEAQCEQEARDYGIVPEQQTEYINGCILSLGGSLPADPVVEQSEEETGPGTTEVELQETMQEPTDVQ